MALTLHQENFSSSRVCYRKPQAIIMQSCRALFRRLHLHVHTWSSGIIAGEGGGEKDCKSQRVGEFTVRMCLLATPETTPIKSHWHDCPNMSWKRMTPMSMPNQTGKSPWGLGPTQRTTGNRTKLGAGEVFFPRGRAQQLVVFCQMVSPENVNASNMIGIVLV